MDSALRPKSKRPGPIAAAGARLFHRGEHVIHRRLHFRIRQRQIAAPGRHRARALEGVLVKVLHAVHKVHRPGLLVAELRRVRHGRGGRRFLELRAGGVGHVDHRAFDFDVGEIGCTAARRHRAFALQRHLGQFLLTLPETWSPVAPVAEFRSFGDPGRMARRADGLVHLFPGLEDRTGRRSEEHTSELQSLAYLVCRLLLEKKKEEKKKTKNKKKKKKKKKKKTQKNT